jgi:hypothetical protein
MVLQLAKYKKINVISLVRRASKDVKSWGATAVVELVGRSDPVSEQIAEESRLFFFRFRISETAASECLYIQLEVRCPPNQKAPTNYEAT